MTKSHIPSWWLVHLWDKFLPLTALTNVVHGRWISAWTMKRRRLPNANSCLAMHFKAQHLLKNINKYMLGGDLHDFVVYHRPYLWTFLQQQNIDVKPFPSKSPGPDLNTIKHIWHKLNCSVWHTLQTKQLLQQISNKPCKWSGITFHMS